MILELFLFYVELSFYFGMSTEEKNFDSRLESPKFRI